MRPLAPVPAAYGPQLLAALRAALAGTGPAVLPVPTGPAGPALLAALTPGSSAAGPAAQPGPVAPGSGPAGSGVPGSGGPGPGVPGVGPDGRAGVPGGAGGLPGVDDDVVLVVPTSGSTGVPKGVALSADALAASADATAERLGGPGEWLLALPVTHVAGLQVVLRALRAGTEPVAADPGDPAAFVAATEVLSARSPARRYASLVPTQLRRLLDAGGPDALRAYDAVLLGGAAAPSGLVEEARAAGVRLVTTYGMSETCGGCVYDGVPLPGVTVAISGGRIVLGGPTLARGYLGGPPFGDRFVTADLGRLDGGRLTVLGRADDVIVTGGENVDPAAVEAALTELPGVREAAVVGVPDPEWGSRVVATVVGTATLAEARAHVTARLGPAAAPRELHLAAALPLLPSGKLDRAALRR
jgi:o-succinylbenzoate---CoA ligase